VHGCGLDGDPMNAEAMLVRSSGGGGGGGKCARANAAAVGECDAISVPVTSPGPRSCAATRKVISIRYNFMKTFPRRES
jgi:hypothetical protein